jgi:hypothetical protein
VALASTSRASERFSGRTFYWGDLHAHTGLSPDGGSSDLANCDEPSVCLALVDAIQTAQANGLDFVAFTDHSTSDEPGYNDFLAELLEANSDTFVTIPSMELRFFQGADKVGHKNIYVFQDDNSLLSGLSLDELATPEDITACSDIWDHTAAVAAKYGPTLEWAHHPTNPRFPTDYSCHDQTYEPVIEAYSGVGNSFDIASDYDVVIDGTVESGTAHEALETFGLRVGFVSGTDIHDTQPGQVCATCTQHPESHVYGGGLTMVVLDNGTDFKRSAIYGEMVARRTLVTSGPQIPVVVEATTHDGVVHPIGEDITVARMGRTMVQVSIPMRHQSVVTGVDLVGYTGRISLDEKQPGVWRVSLDNAGIPDWLYAEVAIDGAAFYGGAGACADGGTDDREFVWSSPFFFVRPR